MLIAPRPVRGFNLVELLVVMSIAGFLLAMAGPMFGTWLQSNRIRTTGESILAGLQMAKAEAVARNARVRFQLTTTLDGTCDLSTEASNWVVNVDPDGGADDVVGNCDEPADDSVAPRILQARSAAEGSGSVEIEATASNIAFNGLGRVTPAGAMTIDITNPAGGECAADGGDMTCLRILVSAGGQIRMCNPLFVLSNDNPQGCPAL